MRVMQNSIVIPRPPSSPWLLRRCVATWIRILNSSELTSSPSFQRKSTLRYSIVCPKGVSLFGGIVLALNFLRVGLPGGPLRSSAITCDFCGIPGHISPRCFRCMSHQRAGRDRFPLILGLRVAALIFSSLPGSLCISFACLC